MSRLLHEPTIRLRSLSEDRGHASLELVRELFGLREDAPAAEPLEGFHPSWRRSTTCPSAAQRACPAGRRADAGPADDPPAPHAALMRIGTRGSALALAQADLVVALLRAAGYGTARSCRS